GVGQGARHGEHGFEEGGNWGPLWIVWWIGTYDAPIIFPGSEEHVLAVHPLTVQDDRDLALAPLESLIGTSVPDRHVSAAVLAFRDLSGERRVLQRMVLGAHGESHCARFSGKSLRYRERDQPAVALEAHVPVQIAGMMFVHDERVAVALRRRDSCAGRRVGGVSFPRLVPVLLGSRRHKPRIRRASEMNASGAR